MPASFAGRRFDAQLLEDLPAGVDPCGENGEFHTCVTGGPMFSRTLPVVIGERVERDGYAYTPTDKADIERTWPQLKGLFLVDRNAIVRWTYIECSEEGIAGIGRLVSEDAILGAARACAG